jgi:lysophospholipase L1-like esterase
VGAAIRYARAMNRKLWLPLVSALLLLLAVSTIYRLSWASSTIYFLGDSLIHEWWYPRVNGGVWGQTSDQILNRFPAGLNGQGIRRIYILAGTNDVLLKRDLNAAAANIEQMVILAREQGVTPTVATIPPIYENNEIYQPRVQVLNEKIRSLAARDHVCLVDYYGALFGHPKYESGGLHMKKLGYFLMEYELLKDTHACE